MPGPISEAYEALEHDIDRMLRAKGWNYTSHTPGCLWLWVTLPAKGGAHG